MEISMTLLLLSLLGCAPKYPSKPDPQARQELHRLFENHIQAIGGRTKFLSKKTLLIKGRVRTMSSSTNISFETIKIAPNQIWTTLTSLNGEKRSKGWDGTQGWQGDRLLSLEKSKDLARSAEFYFPLNHGSEYLEAFEVKTTKFGGRTSIMVLAKTVQGEWQELFFDKNSKLLLGYARWRKGGNRHWYRFGHYTNIDGVRHPLSIEEKYDQVHKVILIESVKWDVPDQKIPFPEDTTP
jgi:hypothetical protein